MEGLAKPYIHLVLANPKPSVYEKVVEKAVELGVKSVFTVSSENSFFKTADRIKLKENRIKKIINQAMQQSNRAEELVLEEPQSLDGFLENFKSGSASSLGVMLYEAKVGKAELQSLRDVEPPENCYILVGGEGGFTEEEALKACSVGFTAVLIGPQILRVETACVAGISILKFALRAW
jgi:16S rRNA (uracil1498-N3)-methyltransferase